MAEGAGGAGPLEATTIGSIDSRAQQDRIYAAGMGPGTPFLGSSSLESRPESGDSCERGEAHRLFTREPANPCQEEP